MNRREFLGTTAVAAGGAASGFAGGMAHAGEARAGESETLDAPRRSRVWQIGGAGGFETLRLATRATPMPGRGEVLVEVHMSGLAARDQAIVRGWFLEDKPPTRIPLSEGVGTVVAVGEDVTHVAVGERVTCAHFARWISGPWDPVNYAVDVGNTVDGWLGERVILPASGVLRVPDGVDDRTAATVSGSGVTAWQALHEIARVRAGDTVLTLGTGGVSTWGLLLAKAAGARVVITSSSDEKLAQMRALGADVTVNYRRHRDWGERIHAETGGANIVLETVGRITLDRSMQACANNAMVVMIGTTPLPERLPEMPGLYVRNLGLRAISNGSRDMLAALLRAVAANGIEAVVGGVFGFEEVVAAFEYAAAADHAGKVLIDHRR